MPRDDLRAATRAAIDDGALENAGGTKVFFPALVFFTGLLLIGAEIPCGTSSSASGGLAAAAASKTNVSLLPFVALAFCLLEARAGESLLGASPLLDLSGCFLFAAEAPAGTFLFPLLDGAFPDAATCGWSLNHKGG